MMNNNLSYECSWHMAAAPSARRRVHAQVTLRFVYVKLIHFISLVRTYEVASCTSEGPGRVRSRVGAWRLPRTIHTEYGKSGSCLRPLTRYGLRRWHTDTVRAPLSPHHPLARGRRSAGFGGRASRVIRSAFGPTTGKTSHLGVDHSRPVSPDRPPSLTLVV